MCILVQVACCCGSQTWFVVWLMRLATMRFSVTGGIVLDFQLHLSSTASLINTLVRMVLPLLRFNSRLGGWLPFLWVGDHCEFVHHDQHGILDVIAEPDLLLTFGIRYGRLFDADRWNVGIAITLTTDVAPMHSRSIVQFHDLSSPSPLCKDINECWLFHCTSSDICLYAWQAPHHVSIQRISFFSRPPRVGFRRNVRHWDDSYHSFCIAVAQEPSAHVPSHMFFRHGPNLRHLRRLQRDALRL